MGQREFIAAPSIAGRAAVQVETQEFAVTWAQIRSLLQEARTLREEATALLRRGSGSELHRRGLLCRQALRCSTEALALLTEVCFRRSSYGRELMG